MFALNPRMADSQNQAKSLHFAVVRVPDFESADSECAVPPPVHPSFCDS